MKGLMAVTLMVGILSGASVVSAADLTAVEIMQKSSALYQAGVKQEEETVEIVLLKRGKTKKKTLVRQSLFSTDEKKIRVMFTAPLADKGRKLRIIQSNQTSVSDVIYFFEEGMKKELRVVGSNSGRRFVGDIVREDIRYLSGENTAEFDYQLVSEDSTDWVIKATAKPEVDTNYSFRKIWVEKSSFAQSKMEYYDENGQLEKVQKSSGLVEIINPQGAWRIKQLEIFNPKKETSTKIEVVARKVE